MARYEWLCIFMSLVANLATLKAGISSLATEVFVSATNGNDDWLCTRAQPCKTISRAVEMVTWGGYVHLNGTDTETQPYNCQPVTSHHPGIYVSKSLSLIGYNSKARVTCTDGHTFMFDGSESESQMTVALRNLVFHNTPVNFLDSAVEIDDCTFFDVRNNCAVNTTMLTRSLLVFSVNNSMFQNNDASVSIVIDRKATENYLTPTKVFIDIANTAFKDNNITLQKNVMFSATASKSAHKTATCDVAFRNTSFWWSTVEAGPVYGAAVLYDVENATTTVKLEDVVFNRSKQDTPLTYCNLTSGHNVTLLIKNIIVSNNVGGAFKVSSKTVTMKVWNSIFEGTSVGYDNNGGAISIESGDICQLTVDNCTFLNTSGIYGGAIYLAATQSSVEIHNSRFTKTKAITRGEAIYVDVTDALSFILSESTIEGPTCAFCERVTPSTGAISIAGQNVETTVQGCTFIGNRDYYVTLGGAMFILGSSHLKLTVHNSLFVGFKALRRGALTISTAGTLNLSVQNSSFIKCKAQIGGAISVIASSQSVLAHAYLSRAVMRSKKGHGAGKEGLNLKGPKQLEEVHSVFDSNDGSVEPSRMSLMNTSFTKCVSKGYGGAVNVNTEWSSYLTIYKCKFLSNSANGPGGALSVVLPQNSTLTVDNCEFSDNSAKNNMPSGSVFISNATDILIDKKYGTQNKTAHQSLGYTPNVTFRNTKFENNTAFTGGAISLYGKLHVIFSEVIIKSNQVTYGEGAVSIHGSNIEIEHSLFENNRGTQGSSLYVESTEFSTVLLANTSFKNCQSSSSAGAVYIELKQTSSFVAEGCTFANNTSFFGSGGAIVLLKEADTAINTGCFDEPDYLISPFRSWHYENNVYINNTRFERNIALTGGAVVFHNGQTHFYNCTFKNNFARVDGGHVYTSGNSTSVLFHNSTFLQTLIEYQGKFELYSQTSFIHTTSAGPLSLYDTTLDFWPRSTESPILVVLYGGLVDFGNDNMTRLLCANASKMQFRNYSNIRREMTTNAYCKIWNGFLQYTCITCASGSYSLQRGQARGFQTVPGFECSTCPYGANCSQSIVAQDDFWGYELPTDPATLEFVSCPLGYCKTPKYPNLDQEYNSCKGNRTGVLCGRCRENFTETLYSSHCRPSDKCNDYWFWPLGLLFVTAMALYLITNPPIFSWLSRQVFWCKVQESEAQAQTSREKGYKKIVFYFYQTATLLLISKSPSALLKTYSWQLMALVGLFNFQQMLPASDGLLCPLPGLSVVTKQLLQFLNVINTFVMIYVIYAIQYAVRKTRGRGPPIPGPYLSATVEVLLLGYSSLVAVSSKLLWCVPVRSGRSLFYDGNVVCFQWWQYLIIAFVAMFVVPFALALAWGSAKLHKGTTSAKHFVLACVFPLPFLFHWTFTWCRGLQHECEDDQDSKASLERVLYAPFRKPVEDRAGISWESVLIGRRLLLIVLRNSITDPLSRVLSLTFTSVLILLHHVIQQPYQDPKANMAETLSLLCLVALGTINTFQSVFPSVEIAAKGPLLTKLGFCEWLEFAILGLMPALFVLALLMAIISQLVRALLWVLKVISAYWVCCFHDGNDELKPLLDSNED